MASKVLVPIDDSDRATKALEFAIENYPDAEITALHIVNPSNFPAGGFESGVMTNFEQIHENQTKHGERLLEIASERASELGVDIVTEIKTGSPANAIVSYAEDGDFDLITIGSRGRTGASRVLLGSVAETVTRRSAIPVTVVR